jgi:putative DNA primase/helicase
MDAASFRDAIVGAGLVPPDSLTPGRFYRFPGTGKGRSNTAGWCKLFPDGLGGVFGDFSTGLEDHWQAKHSRLLSLHEREAFREHCRRARKEAEAERTRAQAEAASNAAELWGSATPATTAHAYLTAKRVQPHGTRMQGNTLLVPMRDGACKLWNLQRIAGDGSKRFYPAARVTGCYFGLGKPGDSICIVEGFATGASVHEATRRAVAVAFNTGNVAAVARELRAKYPELTLILCADDDYRTEGNPGRTVAADAAREVGGLVAFPDFGPIRPDGATDFNDLHQLHGAEAVERDIANAEAPQATESPGGSADAPSGDSWPHPQPLEADSEAGEYPLAALPGGIRDAVQEVVAFVQCPPALAACSALSALSLAAQSLADVKRADGLSGPMSLYFLAVAESGERKTTCDKAFLDGVRQWEGDCEQATQDEAASSRRDVAAWNEQREGILAAIRQAAKNGTDFSEHEAALLACERNKPAAFRLPRLIRTDATPEALAHGLAHGWPSGGVMSSEAGIVLGGHGMKRESVMRNLALLNSLWDGTTQRVERRGDGGTFTLTGARLTVGLAAQPEAVRQFMEGTNGLARGSGFTARFLIAAPKSTQGTRLFKPSANGTALASFASRLAGLLRNTAKPNASGALELPTLDFDAQAFEVWRKFHDDVECELRPGGDLADVRDVASKAADNVARLAALFHVYRHGPSGRIGADEVRQAGFVVGWHLLQARAFLNDVAAPRHVSNARRLDAWLVDRCRILEVQEVDRREAQHRGPLRVGRELDAALCELAEAGRVRLVERGRKRPIEVNPALLGGPQ